MSRIVFRYLITLCLALSSGSVASADDAAAFFDDSTIKEIRLYFDDTNWYNTLTAGHRSAADPYFPCRFQSGSTNLPRIGCRFKGNSSFQRNGVKKPFKLDFNEYENATFMGLKKLNLNNFDLSPDFMREKLLHDMAGKFVTALRSVYVRLYVNDNLYGLYLAVEQPDKTMMQSRFGKDEDGNLYEAEERLGGGAGVPDLSWLGADPALYRNIYLLETNETANDYSGLVEFLDVLNNTPAAELSAKIEPIVDVEDWLTWMAINNIVVNLDSYIGVAAEYYLYDRSFDGRFIHIQWDHNESFGITGDGTPRLATPAGTDPFYLPTTGGMGGGRPGGGAGGGTTAASRPLLTKLWAVDAYKRLYLQSIARVLRGSFNPGAMGSRIDQLASLIREHVNADPNKAYTSAQFETNLNSAVGSTPGMKDFINARHEFLRTYLNGQTQPNDIRINEVAQGWVELLNLGPGSITLSGYYLSDDPANATKWAVPSRTLADGEYLVIDGGVQLQAAGGKLYLFSTAFGSTPIDSVTYPALSAGESLMRAGNFGSQWLLTSAPSSGSANTAAATAAPQVGTGQLKINEFMADNKTTLQDPQEAGAFEDWFEIYNPGTGDVDMSGMYLTDDPANKTKYRVPSGVRVPAKGFVVFWADNDTGQGAMHTNFALDADREQILIYASDGATLIDSVTFQTQQEDISYGRVTDGADTWTIFRPATPGAANASPYASWITNAASFQLGAAAPGSIASAFGQGLATATTIASTNPLPTAINDVTVTLVDSANATHNAGLFFVSPEQVNFLVPATIATGRARVTLRKQDGITLTGDLLVARTGPGLFSANATGEGIGLITGTRVDAANAQTPVDVFNYDPAQQKVVAVPLNLGASTDRVYLTVYATGVRGAAALSDVKAQVGDVDIPVLFAGAQEEFLGLDQINIGPLPQSLAGKGSVEVELTINSSRANRVTVTIQ